MESTDSRSRASLLTEESLTVKKDRFSQQISHFTRSLIKNNVV